MLDKKQTCIIENKGTCHSDYNYGTKCDGTNLPESCPYNKKKLNKITGR